MLGPNDASFADHLQTIHWRQCASMPNGHSGYQNHPTSSFNMLTVICSILWVSEQKSEASLLGLILLGQKREPSEADAYILLLYTFIDTYSHPPMKLMFNTIRRGCRYTVHIYIYKYMYTGDLLLFCNGSSSTTESIGCWTEAAPWLSVASPYL